MSLKKEVYCYSEDQPVKERNRKEEHEKLNLAHTKNLDTINLIIYTCLFQFYSSWHFTKTCVKTDKLGVLIHLFEGGKHLKLQKRVCLDEIINL